MVRRSPSARNSSRPLVTKSDAALWAPSGMVGAGLTNCKLLARLLLQFRRLMRTSGTPLSYFPRIWRSRQTRSTPPQKATAPSMSWPTSFVGRSRLVLCPPIELPKNKKPRPLAGALDSRIDAGMLHLGLTKFALGVPNPTSLFAISLCLCSRHVRREGGSGKSYCEAKRDNRCNYFIHDYSSLCVTGKSGSS